MALPWKLRWFDGPGDNRTPYKIYPNKDGSEGLQVRATEEEVTFAQRVEELEKEVAALRASEAAREVAESAYDAATRGTPKAKR